MRVSLRSRLFFSFFIVMVVALTAPCLWARFVLRERSLAEARMTPPPSAVEARPDAIFRDRFISPLIAALIAAAILARVLAVLLARKIETPIRDMVDMIGRIATNERRPYRMYPEPGGEFARLADAVNAMAERVELSIAAREAQKAQLETILRVMEEGVLVLGSQGRIRMANDMLARLFPLAADAEGRHPIEVIPSAELQEAIDALLTPPHSGAASTRLQIEPRRNLILSVQLARPSIPQHAVEAVAVFHNVTDLVHLMRIRHDFVANVSHELRTPLTSIQGYAETMAELAPEDEAMRARCLDTIRRHAAQMSRLVEDLLSLTRLQSDSLALARQDVKLADLARRVAGGMGTDAKHLNVAITVAEDLRVHADEHLLSQVFRNLLENACRYAPSGTAIEIDAVQNGDELITSVRDHGQGIPPYALTRVFERFYQVEPWRDSHSSGLGLAICRHIVERHGGRIWAENARGAVIRFALPLGGAPEQPAGDSHAGNPGHNIFNAKDSA